MHRRSGNGASFAQPGIIAAPNRRVMNAMPIPAARVDHEPENVLHLLLM